MAVLFSGQMMIDLARGPRQPWHVEERWVTSADDKPVAKCPTASDARLIAGTLTATVAINGTLHRLAHLLTEVAKHGPDSNAGKRLKAIMARLLQMQADGKLPDLG
jgi:hypothetical protein